MTMTSDPLFDDWLRTALGQRNVSGSTLARVLGLPFSIVAAWLSGTAVPEAGLIPLIRSISP